MTENKKDEPKSKPRSQEKPATSERTSEKPLGGRLRAAQGRARQAAVHLGDKARALGIFLLRATATANVLASVAISFVLSSGSIFLGLKVLWDFPDFDPFAGGGFLAFASAWIAYQKWVEAEDFTEE